MSSACPSAEASQSAVNLFVVDEEKEAVYRQLISVAGNCPQRLREYVAAVVGKVY